MNLLIFDSSTIINLVLNGLEEILPKMKKLGDIRFIVTSAVRFETIKRPVQSKKYELDALKIKRLLDENVLETPSSIGIDEEAIESQTQKIMDVTNRILFARDTSVHLIDKGEASCLALYNMLRGDKRIKKMAIAIDERTTRMLGEKPENLRKLMEQKLHTKVDINSIPDEMKNVVFIRSAEIVYIAYKKGLIELADSQVLDALLWASKFAGCSISSEEIEEIKRL